MNDFIARGFNKTPDRTKRICGYIAIAGVICLSIAVQLWSL